MFSSSFISSCFRQHGIAECAFNAHSHWILCLRLRRAVQWMCVCARASKHLMDFYFFVQKDSVTAVGTVFYRRRGRFLCFCVLLFFRWANVSQFMHVVWLVPQCSRCCTRSKHTMPSTMVERYTTQHWRIATCVPVSLYSSVHVCRSLLSVFSCKLQNVFMHLRCDANAHICLADGVSVCLWVYWMHARENCQCADEAIFIWVKGSKNAWQNVISRSGRYGNDSRAKTKS